MSESPEGMTRRIARFVVETDAASIPAEIREHAKIALLDWYGVTLAGKDDPLVLKLIRLADTLGGREQATILGHGKKTQVCQAALVNGAASHALDYDDTLVSFLGHPSVALFPGLLALAEWRKFAGIDLLTAYLVGFKVGAVLGACSGLSHYLAGWHSTSTIGHLASAAACARLLRLDLKATVHAIGIAATQASGLKRVFGTMCKPFHAGKASQGGLLAALLAEEGFDAPHDTLEGPQGFFDAFRGEKNEQALDTLGVTWDIENLAQKYHASCHFTHSPIEAAWKAVGTSPPNPDEIRSIRVRTSKAALSAAHHMDPTTGLAAKFSIPYCVANAILRGDTGLAAFQDERVNEPSVRALMKKISVEVEEQRNDLGATVEVVTQAGEVRSASSDILVEVVPLEVKRKKILAKFEDLSRPAIGAGRAAAVEEAILGIERLSSLEVLFS